MGDGGLVATIDIGRKERGCCAPFVDSWEPQVWEQLSGLATAVNIHASLLSAALLLALVDQWQHDM